MNALVAQLDRVTGYEPVGRGFESLQARQKNHLAKIAKWFFFYPSTYIPVLAHNPIKTHDKT